MGQSSLESAPDLLAIDHAGLAAVYEKGRWRHQAQVLHAVSPHGQTLAHWAASHPEVATLLPPLLTAGARLREPDKDLATPLVRLIQNPFCTPALLEGMFVHGAEVGNLMQGKSLLRVFLGHLSSFQSPLPVARQCMDVLLEEARRCDGLVSLAKNAWVGLRLPDEARRIREGTFEDDRKVIVDMGLDLIRAGTNPEMEGSPYLQDRSTFLNQAFREEIPEWVTPLLAAGAKVQPYLNGLALDLLEWSHWDEDDGPWPPLRRARFEALHEALFGMLAGGADPLLPVATRWEPKGVSFWDFLDTLGPVGVAWRTGFQARLESMALTGALPEARTTREDLATRPSRIRRL